MSHPRAPLRKRAIQALGSLTWSLSTPLATTLLAFLLVRLADTLTAAHLTSLPPEFTSILQTARQLVQARAHLEPELSRPASMETTKTLLQCLNTIT
ncbi:unnamed protein product [Protopolystoma xenopodis]|uniref:Uncharacterized protein n=1 Tax=Protopolystoma xenopodis TaxID=117903 RepID=A0A3S5CHP2_9PLAT|nr:unnamed protein product [Protopolystoma xenopodis]